MCESAKFPISETKLGRDMKIYPDDVLIRTRKNSGIQYRFEIMALKEFLESKKWWFDF